MDSEKQVEKSKDDGYVVETLNGEPDFDDAVVAVGAPVEKISPLGYHVGWVSVLFLNISKMIGTGVYTTPGSILKGVGSVGLSLVYWVIGFFFAAASLCVYLEFSSYFPHRSGAEVAYLEKAYPKPRFLMPTVFAVQSVLLTFSSSNSIIFAQYILAAADLEPTTWRVRGLAVGVFTFIILCCIISTNWSLRISNAFGIVKTVTLIFIAITGLVVLGGHTKVVDPHANFRNSFEGTLNNANGLATALVKVNFAYSGFENAFNVMNEIKNPVRTMKRTAPLSLGIVFVLYFFANIAYFAAIPKDVILHSNTLTGGLFFQAVFGTSKATKALSALIAISAFGNILSTAIGTSRVIRECGRQGVLPWPSLWSSTKPFNTPLVPLLVKWVLTVIVIIAPPAGDAFNFIVDLQSYPGGIFLFLLTFGLFLVRRARKKANAPPSEFRAWTFVLVFSLAVNVYLLILPWVPPQGGIYAGDVSFFYATYCIVGLAIIAVSALAYLFWIQVLPKLGGYELRQVVEHLSDGAQNLKTIKVPKDEVDEWDKTHDEFGNPL